MYFEHPLFAIVLCLFSLLLVRATFHYIDRNETEVAFGAVNGLRGYLAFFVFLHHATIWFAYTRSHRWDSPASHLYAHLGQSSVALFFMITSFLFYGKLLDGTSRPFAWRAFFIGRVFRLTPLYAVVMLAMFLMVAWMSHWTLHERPQALFSSMLYWMLFTIPGAPTINQIDPFLIVAGVMWSLSYEWCFYLLLPLIALTTAQRPAWTLLALSALALVVAWQIQLQVQHAGMFVGGMIAARLARHRAFQAFAKGSLASPIVLGCFITVLFYPNVFQPVPWLCLTTAFCLIAGGADLFGILSMHSSRRLGELAYSMYLVHGLMLFTMIHFVVGKNKIAAMSAVAYWSCVALLTPCLLGLSALTFIYVERPGIKMGKKLAMRWAHAESAGRTN